MKFYGQEKLVQELQLISREVIKGNNQNLLFIAQSGYGKTTLAWLFSLWCVNENLGKYNSDVQYITAQKTTSREDLILSKKIIIIDEVHVLDSFEWLFELLDSKNITFIFCTNEYGELPEPLIRRCFVSFFEPYTNENYMNILTDFFVERKINLPINLIEMILSACKKTPGYVIKTAERLSIIFKNSFLPRDEEELNEVFVNILGIKNGLDLLDRRYLDTLESLGGISGLERIITYSRIPRKVIEREIEPFLLEKKILEITNKGRKIV